MKIGIKSYNSFSLRENERLFDLKIGDKVRTTEGWMQIENFGSRDCGSDDDRTGLPIIDGKFEGQTYGEREGSWIYAMDVLEVRQA